MIIQDETTTELVERAPQISDLAPQDQEAWLEGMGNSLKRWDDLSDFVTMGQAKILYIVWSLWDDRRNEYCMAISREATSKWSYDFFTWAKSFTKKRTLREPDETTILNKITVYRDWVLGSIQVPSIVFLPKRDNLGKVISDDREETWEQVEFNPMDCDYSKLLIARGAAKKGEMSPDSWSCLRDPFSTANDLKSSLNGEGTKTHKEVDDFRLWKQDETIYATKDEETIPIAQLLFENEDSELFKRGVNHLLQAAGCKPCFEFAE
jgi:hypothetical protein